MKQYFNIALLSTLFLINTTYSAQAVGRGLSHIASKVGPATAKTIKWGSVTGLPPFAVILFEIIGEHKTKHGEDADLTVNELAYQIGLRTKFFIKGVQCSVAQFSKGLGEDLNEDVLDVLGGDDFTDPVGSSAAHKFFSEKFKRDSAEPTENKTTPKDPFPPLN